MAKEIKNNIAAMVSLRGAKRRSNLVLQIALIAAVVLGSAMPAFATYMPAVGNNNDVQYKNGFGFAGSDNFVVNGTNIGIGTTVPQGGFVVMNGNVGIGTWVPAGLLQVGNNFSVASNGTVTAAGSTLGNVLTVYGGGEPVVISSESIATYPNEGLNFSQQQAGGNSWSGTSNATAFDFSPSGQGTITDTAGQFTTFEISPTYSEASGTAANTDLLIDRTETAIGSGPQRMIDAQVAGVSKFTVLDTGNLGIGTFNPYGGKLIITGGNVGIGSLAPGTVLDVQGTVRATNFIGNGSGLTGLSSGLWATQNTTDQSLAGGNVGIGTTITNAGAALSVMNGNVGIGTWVPGNALSVNGAIYTSGNLTAGGNLSVNIGEFANTAVQIGASQLENYATSSGSSFNIIGGSNVGSHLTLTSTAKTGNGDYIDFEIGNVGVGTVDVMRMINGNVGVGSINPGQTLDVQGTVRATNFVGNGSGLTGLSSGLWATQNTTDQSLAGGNVGIGTTITNAGAALSVMNGNVGIGTWVPSQPLHIVTGINGGIEVDSSNTTGASIYLNNTSTGGKSFTFFSTGSANTPGHFGVYDKTDNQSSLDINGTNGTQTLIDSAVLGFASGTNALLGPDTGISRLSADKIAIGNGTQADASGILITTNIGIGTTFVGGTGEAALSVMNGNVGIGTWVPSTPLNIVMNSSSTSLDTLDIQNTNANGKAFFGAFNNNSVGLKMGVYGSSFSVSALANLAVLSGTAGDVIISDGGSTSGGTDPIIFSPGGYTDERMRITGAGNVGIGSTVPGQMLDVNGTVRDIGGIVNGNVGIGTSFVNGSGEGALSVMNGNVGIGTWLPSSALAVEGQISTIASGSTANLTALTNGTNYPRGSFEIGNSTSDVNVGLYVSPSYSSNTLQIPALISVATDKTPSDSNELETLLYQTTTFALIGSLQEGGGGTNGTPLEFSTQTNVLSGSPPALYISNAAAQNIGIGTTIPQGGLVVMNGNVGIGTWVPGNLLAVGSASQFQVTSNGRINPRVNTIASSATPAIDTDTTDMFTITALAANVTSMTTNLTGTPVNGQKLIIRFLDNGTARTIAWGASFNAIVPLPTTTVASKYLYVGFIYNSAESEWDCIASIEQ